MTLSGWWSRMRRRRLKDPEQEEKREGRGQMGEIEVGRAFQEYTTRH